MTFTLKQYDKSASYNIEHFRIAFNEDDSQETKLSMARCMYSKIFATSMFLDTKMLQEMFNAHMHSLVQKQSALVSVQLFW